MTAPARWAVILDPLGMANVVSDRQPGPGLALEGLTGAWERYIGWMDLDDALDTIRHWNKTHGPARPGERANER